MGFPNDDAYYTPEYIEKMLQAAEKGRADLVCCDWVCDRAYTGRPKVGQIDVGGFLVKRDLMLRHGWPDRGPTGDGKLVESLVAHGAKAVRMPDIAYVKN